MAQRKSKRLKRKKRTRSPPSKIRFRRLGLWVLVLLAGVVAVYAYDRGGPMETIPAQVVEVRTYPHTPRGGETHTHTDAVIEYEGARHTLERADSSAKGKWGEVDIRRGRLTGWPHFEAFRGTAEIDLLQPAAESPEPWEYDLVLDRHWDPTHAHWHDGPPPSRRR